MTATPNRLSTFPFNEPGNNPSNQATYISARVLAQNVAEVITVPSGASYVRLAGNCNFFANIGGAAAVPADTDDGTANEIYPVGGAGYEWRDCHGAASIGVITPDAAGGIVTASFYTV